MATLKTMRSSCVNAWMILGTGALSLLLACPGAAESFPVNSTADLPDSAPSNSVCSTGRTTATGQLECTFRAAVQEANAHTGADTIVVPAGKYNLSMPSICNYKDRRNTHPLAITSRTLCITGETNITGSGSTSTVVDGMALERVFFISDGAVVTISSLTVQNGNQSGATFNGLGAAINNQGTLTVLDSNISGNTSSGAGGAIHTEGSLTIRRSAISNNTGSGDGGGIWLFSGSLIVSDSTFDGNGTVHGGGAIALYSGSASISGSTFSNNTAGGGGGALRLFNNSIAHVTNSTFSANAASSAGGAIRNDTGTLYLNNVTVARNRATGFAGAGVYGTMHMRNSIIAANTSINPNFFSGADCLVVSPGSIISEGYNLIQDGRNCNITGATTGNIIGQDARLGALSLNGGGTQTISLLPSSLAIDAGSPNSGAGGTACAAFDQRTILRPQGARCDIGAFERNSGFAVSRITPARGGNTGSTLVVISGAGFGDGASLRLRRAGQPDRPGSPATVEAGGFSIASSLDLTDLAAGLWDVVVANADATVAILPGAFTVQAPQAPDLWSYVVGRSAIRPGVPVKYTIVYGNRGNVDALAVPLTLSTPGNFETGIYFEVVPPPPQPGQVPTDWSTAFLAVLPYSPEAQLTVPFLIPVIPAGFSGTLEFSLRLPPTATHGATFAFSVVLGAPLLKPAPDPQAVQRMVNGAAAYAQMHLGATIGSATLPALRSYVTNQLELILAPARDELVATLGAGTLVYSLAQMNIDAARYAASRGSALALKPLALAGRSAAGSKPKNRCSGQVMGESGSCDSMNDITPHPKSPNPNGPAPVDCSATPGHHVSSDGKTCVPDPATPCTANSTDPNCHEHPILQSVDPNEKAGPNRGANITAQTSLTALGYTVLFENKAIASGAAQEVVITDQLDASKLDLSTFSLGPISFGNLTVFPSPGLNSFSKVLDMRPEQNFLVQMHAKLNPSTGLVTWRFSTLDPLSGQATDDPELGFLPANTTPPNGEGHVMFTVQPKRPIATGTRVCNMASIVFDFNAPILTNQWCNTMDDVAPVSRVQVLPAQSTSPFMVRWTGTDMGSAVAGFDIYASDNGGPVTLWLQKTSLNQAAYPGVGGHKYSFFSIARDQAGNLETGKTAAEATTTVASNCSVDVTAQYSIVRGGFRFDYASGRYVQTISATTKSNTAAPQGLRFVLDGLTPNVALANKTGQTSCATPVGSPFIAFPASAIVSPSVAGVLQFVNTGNVAIKYSVRLLAPDSQP